MTDSECLARIEDVHDPAEIGRLGAQVSATKWKLMAAMSSDPAVHVRRIKVMRALGATVRRRHERVFPNWPNDVQGPD